MKSLSWKLFVLLLFTLSCQGEVTEDCNDAIGHLQAQVNQLKEEMEQMRVMMKQLTPDPVKSDSIEEDVKQNTEDIIELKMDIIQNDIRLTRLVKDVNNLNTSLSTDLQTLTITLEETLPPVGTILAWHAGFSGEKLIPAGWQRCDGSLIVVGSLVGQNTPDLNSDGRFLRGAADEQSGQFEEDAMQDHTHHDGGHTHLDNGHSHKDLGHNHAFDDYIPSQDSNGYMYIAKSRVGDSWSLMSASYATLNGYSKLSTDSANIEHSTSNLGGIEGGRIADETRVKNMKIVWIMRVY